MRDGVTGESAKRVLMAKTGLDGHWRGPTLVATALRDAGFEVIMIGMVQAGELVQAAIDEDVDLVGLNMGGHVDVALRAVKQIQDACSAIACVCLPTPRRRGCLSAPWRRAVTAAVSRGPHSARGACCSTVDGLWCWWKRSAWVRPNSMWSTWPTSPWWS